jgi:hypothetical protein
MTGAVMPREPRAVMPRELTRDSGRERRRDGGGDARALILIPTLMPQIACLTIDA